MLLGQGFGNVRSLDGGIDSWDGAAATGTYDLGLSLLDEGGGPGQVIALALALEEGSGIFYREAGKILTDPGARGTFGDLERAEESHRKRLLEAASILPLQLRPPAVGRGKWGGYMEGAVRTAEALAWVSERGRTVFDILELSMQVETNALDLYLKMLGLEEFAPVREVLSSLVEEEKKHLQRLAVLLERHIPPAVGGR